MAEFSNTSDPLLWGFPGHLTAEGFLFIAEKCDV